MVIFIEYYDKIAKISLLFTSIFISKVKVYKYKKKESMYVDAS